MNFEFTIINYKAQASWPVPPSLHLVSGHSIFISPFRFVIYFFWVVCCHRFFVYNLDFKRKIWTWTGIRTFDLQITSLALLPIELSKFPFQFMFKRSSWNDKCQTLSFFACKHLKSAGPVEIVNTSLK